ncbi:hypothetical protein [Trinickia symbiotica]|uniref:hypothetical protein n=1 Tax=Trinickia symbiotica TaxID=863227 RepID=UPI0015E72E64|nr:hypothetical protein [Trinickia symbiotica]
MLDKTGTITVGSRRASAFVPLGTADENELKRLAALASFGEQTPEDKSIAAIRRWRSTLAPRSQWPRRRRQSVPASLGPCIDASTRRGSALALGPLAEELTMSVVR